MLSACATASDPALVAEGERQFQRCYGCHSLDPGETGLSGPSLRAVVGRPAGQDPSFGYSAAMLTAADSGLVWTPEALDAFIADPESVVPETTMAPTGLYRAEDRAALIAYLLVNGR